MARANFQKAKKIFFSNILIIVLVLVLLIFCFGIFRECAKRAALEEELAGLERELQKQKADNDNFLISLDAYNSDFFLEQEARGKFNLKKEGEKVVIIPDSDKMIKIKSDVDSEGEKKLKLNNFELWWNYFFADSGVNG
jgi:cell division protein FtsB